MQRQGGSQGPPQGFGQGPAQGHDGPPQGYDGPPQGFGGPPQGFGGPPQGFGGPPQGFGGPPQGFGGPPGQSAYHQLRHSGGGSFGAEPRAPVMGGAGATPGGYPMGTAGPMDMRSARSGEAFPSGGGGQSAYRHGARPAEGARFRAKAAQAAKADTPAAPTAREVMDGALALSSASQVRGFRDALSDIGLGAGSMEPSV